MPAMQPAIISDTSCLILLDNIDELHLLKDLYGEVSTTSEVATEFGNALPEWVIVRDPQDKTRQLILEASLDKGEASAIALALEQTDCLLIIDELKGRRLAKALGLHVTGSLGLIIEAKRSGLIMSVKPILRKIKQTNFRIDERLEQDVLQSVGEQPDE